MSYNFTQAKRIQINPTTSVASYSANSVVGGLMTANLGSAPNTGGILRLINITNTTSVNIPGTLWIFSRVPQVFNDNTAFLPSATTLSYSIASVVPSYTGVGGISVALINEKNLDFVAEDGKLYLYYVLSSSATLTSTQTLILHLYAFLY